MHGQRRDVTIVSFEVCNFFLCMVTVYIDSPVAITSDNPFLSHNEFSRVNCICNEIILCMCYLSWSKRNLNVFLFHERIMFLLSLFFKKKKSINGNSNVIKDTLFLCEVKGYSYGLHINEHIQCNQLKIYKATELATIVEMSR